MNKEQFLNTGLLEQYALGLTDAEESEAVEQHLEQFPELRDELYAMQEALENYAKQYAISPPDGVKQQIMHKVEDTAPQPRAGRRASYTSGMTWSKWLSYAALIALTLGYLYQSNRYKQTRQELRSTQVSLNSCESQNQSLQDSRRIYAFISDTNTQPITLKGTPFHADASAIVYWNEDRKQGYFFASGLPEPPADKQYQIWADVENEMISIGLLDYQTKDLQAIQYIAEATSLNITLEPKGGSKTPTVSNLYVNAKI
jgi:anti-sigma-K factor RskA